MAAAVATAGATGERGGRRAGRRPCCCHRWRWWVVVVAAIAGTNCLTVPTAKRWQQPWQRRRRTESGEGGERPARTVAGTACLTVRAAKRWHQPWQRRGRPVSREGCELPTTMLLSSAATVGRSGGGGRWCLLPNRSHFKEMAVAVATAAANGERSGEGGDRPAGVVAGTVPAAKIKKQP